MYFIHGLYISRIVNHQPTKMLSPLIDQPAGKLPEFPFYIYITSREGNLYYPNHQCYGLRSFCKGNNCLQVPEPKAFLGRLCKQPSTTVWPTC
jgi:hypothetical protein